ncbi:MAG: thiosulfate oxidation carrier complex protein SoxZ [Pseudomonadota bacterium]
MASSTRRVRVALPDTATAGSVITAKALISHPMETGYRRDAMGKAIARNILTRFRCLYDDEPILDIELNPGIAANPFLSFRFRAVRTGTIHFEWTDQNGTVTREQRTLTAG